MKLGSLVNCWQNSFRIHPKKASQYWLLQRVTAVALLPLLLIFGYDFATHPSYVSYDETLTWIAEPWRLIYLSLLILLSLYHGYLGVQVIIEDYIPNPQYQALSLKILMVLIGIFALTALSSLSRIMLLEIS